MKSGQDNEDRERKAIDDKKGGRKNRGKYEEGCMSESPTAAAAAAAATP